MADEKNSPAEAGHFEKALDDTSRDGDTRNRDAAQDETWAWFWHGRLPVRPHLRPEPRFGKQELEICAKIAEAQGACPHAVWDYLYQTPYLERVDDLMMYQGAIGVKEAYDWPWAGEA
jgi:hypothetical protein